MHYIVNKKEKINILNIALNHAFKYDKEWRNPNHWKNLQNPKAKKKKRKEKVSYISLKKNLEF